ncbi:MAG: 50S ribosomal protein L4 [Eubacteriales bacterium]|nr:50S ribosomal protein L4 [Eubacteriales bacterium]
MATEKAPKVAVYSIAGEKVGEVELNAGIFGVEVNESAMHACVTAYLANQRQGTQSALTRAEVSGGGIKPWRQKGSGRARQGSTRSPQWMHGGIVFAPKPRDYRMSVNKKVKRLALKSALTSKVQDEALVVFDALDIEAAKTKQMIKVLDAVKVEKALIVLPEKDEIVERAAGNIPNVKTTLVGTLNVYELLKYDTLILTKDSLAKIEEVYS